MGQRSKPFPDNRSTILSAEIRGQAAASSRRFHNTLVRVDGPS